MHIKLSHAVLSIIAFTFTVMVIIAIKRSDVSTIQNTQIGKNDTVECVTGHPCVYPDVVDFRVIVITFNRAESLSKLLSSVNTMVLDGDHAALEIWIDIDRRNKVVDQQTIKVASKFRWSSGLSRVHVQVCLTRTLYCRLL